MYVSSEFSNVRASLSVSCSIMRYVTQSYGHSGINWNFDSQSSWILKLVYMYGLKTANFLANN